MDKSLFVLMERFDLTRDQAIHKFNEICNEFSEYLGHDETIRRATNIVEIMFRNQKG